MRLDTCNCIESDKKLSIIPLNKCQCNKNRALHSCHIGVLHLYHLTTINNIRIFLNIKWDKTTVSHGFQNTINIHSMKLCHLFNLMVTEWSGKLTEWHYYVIQFFFSNLLVIFQLTELHIFILWYTVKAKHFRFIKKTAVRIIYSWKKSSHHLSHYSFVLFSINHTKILY